MKLSLMHRRCGVDNKQNGFTVNHVPCTQAGEAVISTQYLIEVKSSRICC